MIPTLNPATAGGGLALPEFVQLASRHGFSGVEFSITEAAALVEATSFEAVATIFEEPKVLPIVFGLPVEWRKDEDTFQAGLAELPALAKLAQNLDCTRCCTWVLPDGGIPVAEYSANSIRRFAEIGRVLQDEGVRFGMEFIGPLHFRTDPKNVWFYDIPGALEVVEQVSQAGTLENIGLLVDCWHWYTSGGTVMDLASIPVEQFVNVHINDAPAIPREEQVDSVRLLPGASGTIDIVGFLKTLDAIGFDGPLSVETFSEDLRALDPEDAAAQASSAVASVMNAANVTPVKLI